MKLTEYIASLVVLLQCFLTYVSSLECYVCDNQDGNTEKCTKTIKTCEVEQDRCLSTIVWSTTPYWTQGAEKQYYVSKRCATKEICSEEINKSMELCHYIWYEDWKCAECCQGDRCNYYVTLGSSSVRTSWLVMATSLVTGILLTAAQL